MLRLSAWTRQSLHPNFQCPHLHAFFVKWSLLRTQVYTFITFSTSDNAFRAFLLVHWISVTSHYTCISPLMEMNVAHIARHKIFPAGSQVSSANKMDENTRFVELSTEETQKNSGQCRPSNNKVNPQSSA